MAEPLEDAKKKWNIPSEGQRGDVPFSAKLTTKLLTQSLTPDTLWEARVSEPREKMLIDTLNEVYEKMGIKGTPKVFIYYADKPIHFYGTTSKGSLVFSTNSLDMYGTSPDAIKSIMGHELTHYKNKETKKSLLVAATDVLLSGILAHAITQKLFKNSGKITSSISTAISTAAIFSGTFFPAYTWYRRRNEYKADLGSLNVASPEARIEGLKALGERREELHLEYGKPKRLSNYIPKPIVRIFSTHPPIQDRIKAISELKTQGFVEKHASESRENPQTSATR